MTQYLFENCDRFGIHFSDNAKRLAGVHLMDSDPRILSPETYDDIAYTEVMRLRSICKPISETIFSGYIADRVKHIYRQLNEGFARGLWDFTYLLEKTAASNFKFEADFVGIDEINDLTPLQLQICSRSVGKEVIFAGDLDQCIYGWSGVDPAQVAKIPVDNVDIRRESFRLPSVIAEYADSIIKQSTSHSTGTIVSKRIGGTIERNAWFEGVVAQIKRNPIAFGRVMIGARTNNILHKAMQIMKDAGLNIAVGDDEELLNRLYKLIKNPTASFSAYDVPVITSPSFPSNRFWKPGGKKSLKQDMQQKSWITWEELFSKYGNSEMKRVFSTMDTSSIEEYSIKERNYNAALPSVEISTLHKSKGLEEDTFILLTDTGSRVESHRVLQPDEEIRLAYVAATRAKDKLIISSLGSGSQSRFIG